MRRPLSFRPASRQERVFGAAFGALVVLAATPVAAAPPVLRVRGQAQVELAAGWLDGRLVVSGSALDDTGRPLAGVSLSLVGYEEHGRIARLGEGQPCSPLAEADKVPGGTPEERLLRTDRSGRFCADFEGEPPASVEIRYADRNGFIDPVARRVQVDRTRRGVELRFVDPPSMLDLEEPAHRLEVGMRTEPQASSAAAPLPVLLFAREGGTERLLATEACRLGSTAVFSLPSTELGGPGPVDLVARFAGTNSLQPAEALRRLSRTARVTLSLASEPDPSDPEDGVALDVAVSATGGALASGAVEARYEGRTVGIAKVEGGVAHVTARFVRPPRRTAELSLHYLPNEPWWIQKGPLEVEVPLAPRSPWTSLAWLLGLVAIAGWLLESWRRPARTPRTDRPEAAPRQRAAAVVVVEKDEAAAGWRGTVRDAHDQNPVRDAQVAIARDEPDGVRTLARAVTDEGGRFELGPLATGDGARFVVSARWHSTLTAALPERGRLVVDLVTRRRQLVARFVAWASREGQPSKGRAEPTPGDVRHSGQRTRRPEVTEWADAVEAAAYGPGPVDESKEREVLAREPPHTKHAPKE